MNRSLQKHNVVLINSMNQIIGNSSRQNGKKISVKVAYQQFEKSWSGSTFAKLIRKTQMRKKVKVVPL